MSKGSWPLFAALSLLWALSFVLARAVVAGFGWAPAAALCSVGVAVATAVAAKLGGRRLSLPRNLGDLAVLGVAVAVQNLGLCLAVDRLGLALTAIMLGSMPLFSTLIGQVWGTDRITGLAASGLVVGFTGLFLVVLFPAEGDSWAFISGVLACLVGALAGAFATRWSTRRLSGRPEALIGGHLSAGIILLPVAVVVGTPAGAVTAWGYAGLVLFAVIIALVGPVLDVRLPEEGRVERSGRIKTVGMVAAMLAGVLAFGETLTPGQVVGLLLVLGGAALVLGLVPRAIPLRGRR
jgi:drug/metabolite transporter (DMT)-like permease